jgi:DNA-binding transcriptional MerR regulator
MEYTVQKLGSLAGVSTRTLRYYDEIELLKPARVNKSGYRIYGRKEVDRLQQILFYKELGVSLKEIKAIIDSPGFDRVRALRQHLESLLAKKTQIDKIIANVEKTIAAAEGRISMSDREKFEGFKQKLVEDNEKKFGEEARERYGDEAVERSNKAFRNMAKEQYDRLTDLDRQVKETLARAFKEGDPAGKTAQRAAELHRQWLTMCWDSYDSDAHAELAQMYVDDDRFRAYYDQGQPGMTEFLRDAVMIYTGKHEA